MKHSVLVVDDDPSILEGYRRVLGSHFELYLACGPFQGIEKLEGGPDYSVVVADMRMPDMNGIEFLKRVRARSPQTRRIMLSGDAEQSTAVDAVNLGQVSAFLAKPCPSQQLLAAVKAAAADWELQHQERQALRASQTGAVQALMELLRAADPALFRRSRRIRRLAALILKARGLGMDWQMEAAALLSQVGTLYLPAELRGKIMEGLMLDTAEEEVLDGHPALGADCLRVIPGFEGIAQSIALQRRPYQDLGTPGLEWQGPALPLASRVLHLAHDMDWFSVGERSSDEVRDRLLARVHRYDPELLQAALGLECGPGSAEDEVGSASQAGPRAAVQPPRAVLAMSAT